MPAVDALEAATDPSRVRVSEALTRLGVESHELPAPVLARLHHRAKNPDGKLIVGRYLVVGELGRGGMGVVYDAWDPGIERRVAIKTIEPALVPEDEREEVIARFRRETKIVGQLKHPAIVTIFDFGQERADRISHDRSPTLLYYVMEYLEGQSLAQALRDRGRIPEREAIAIAADIAEALQLSHEAGVIHRDIKPSNIFLRHGREAVLLDFGIAKLGGIALTRQGQILGTPSYLAPERLKEKQRPIDGRADIFSLGVLLFTMLTGEAPFVGHDVYEVIDKITKQAHPDIKAIGAAGRGLAVVLDRMLAKRPEDRYATAAEASGALRDVLTAAGSSAEAELEAALDRSLAEPPPRPPSRRPSAVEVRPVVTEPRSERWERRDSHADRAAALPAGPVTAQTAEALPPFDPLQVTPQARLDTDPTDGDGPTTAQVRTKPEVVLRRQSTRPAGPPTRPRVDDLKAFEALGATSPTLAKVDAPIGNGAGNEEATEVNARAASAMAEPRPVLAAPAPPPFLASPPPLSPVAKPGSAGSLPVGQVPSFGGAASANSAAADSLPGAKSPSFGSPLPLTASEPRRRRDSRDRPPIEAELVDESQVVVHPAALGSIPDEAPTQADFEAPWSAPEVVRLRPGLPDPAENARAAHRINDVPADGIGERPSGRPVDRPRSAAVARRTFDAAPGRATSHVASSVQVRMSGPGLGDDPSLMVKRRLMVLVAGALASAAIGLMLGRMRQVPSPPVLSTFVEAGPQARPTASAVPAAGTEPALVPPRTASELISDADAARAAGEHQEAARLYTRALGALPQTDGLAAGARFGRAEALRHLGRLPDALAQYREVIRRHPQSKQAAEAQVALRALGVRGPSRIRARVEPPPAPAASSAPTVGPPDGLGPVEACRWIIKRHLTAPRAAVAALEALRDAHPTEPCVYWNLGRKYESLRQNRAALSAYRRFVTLQPDNPKVPAVQRRVANLQSKMRARGEP